MDADVAVIGLGTMGSMTIWQLASQGVSVLGFEQFGIGHDRSAYGGGSRRFRIASPFVEETPFIKASYSKFRELEQKTNQKLLSNSGSLDIGDMNSDRMKNVMYSIEKYNLAHEVLEGKQAMKSYPQHHLLQGEAMIKDEQGGILRPEQTVISAVNHAQSLGARIYSYTPVNELLADSQGVTIHAEEHTYRVGKVVITTGPWANKLVPSLNDVFSVYRLMMTWFMPEKPEEFAESKFPNFSRSSEGFHIQGTPAMDGRMVRVSDNSKKVEIKDADLFDKNVAVKDVLGVRESVKKLLPNLNPDPIRINPFMEGFTTDGLPIVGVPKVNRNIVLVCGFSGQGFSQSPAMGEIAKDLVINNKTHYEIDHLSPNRFGL
ncbi:FAD-dependent oxidoreductase [Virgibacillus sp. NKC19-3]|uniref:FAD-dependent oxidoreductase n=1 Tax=Virgibacillus saliphilus TaxID=2831674 RepID=UPI001C9B69A9|nr:FAD-dependent oxidoreductase [Virgibacillus sp. NKC19-3]MBY7144579.1 FAD-dependent oxidoreductase [Virgibacillus sp. NKC19-3]